MKPLLTTLSLATLSLLTAVAQPKQYTETIYVKEGTPYFYVGARAGIQGVPTNYDFTQLLTPAIGLQVGHQVNSFVGVRVDLQGLWSKSAFRSADETMGFNYLTTDYDLTFNLTAPFIPQPHFMDVSLVVGAGVNYSWGKEPGKYPLSERLLLDYKDSWSANWRGGLLFDFNCNRNWAIQFEVDANALHDIFNAKRNTHVDWQLTSLVGLSYRFGHAKVAKTITRTEAIDRVPVPERSTTQVDVFDEVVYNSADEIHIEIFFDVDDAKIRDTEDAKLRGLSNFLKEHQVETVILRAYADRQTGNPTYNQALSERRAKTIVNLLTQRYGIAPSRINSQAFGDKQQPFAENDLNRVVIIDVK